MAHRLRLAVVRDFRAENWPSMDLCADQLLAHLLGAVPTLAPVDLESHFRRRFQRLPFVGHRPFSFNSDRLLNRHLFLPSALRRMAGDFDLFHVTDHTYAHVVLALPPGRVGVYCHDLDAFRCLLQPTLEPRPWWFRKLARRILKGLQRAAVVFYSTNAVREQLLLHKLILPERLVHAPYGVAAEFTPEANASRATLPDHLREAQYLLHVGSNIPRKRLDVLLDLFAIVRVQFPNLRLVQVGGPWPADLAERIERLRIGPAVTQLRGLTRQELAELYRRASATLITSEAEGFGLPAIEALACGTPVIASDLPVLREVGGDAVSYCPVANVPAWVETVRRILTEPDFVPARHVRLERASRFSWHEHARTIGEAYLNLRGR